MAKLSKKEITEVVVFGVWVFLMALGSWQVYRLYYKHQIMAEIQQRTAMEPLKGSAISGKVSDLQFRRVVIDGVYLHEDERHLFMGPLKPHGESGYHLLTPMRLINGTVILVDRGWVPAKLKERSTRPQTLPEYIVTIEAMLQMPEHKGWALPANDKEKNMWFWVDTDAMLEGIDGAVKGMYFRSLGRLDKENALSDVEGDVGDDIDEDEGQNEGGADKSSQDEILYPIPGDTYVQIRNDHLYYAIIWYSLAFILVVIYIVYRRGEAKKAS